MKIAKVVNHGHPRWQVNVAVGTYGKRQRKFFDTKEQAEQFVRDRTEDKDNFGKFFSTLPMKERGAIMYHLERLKGIGWTLAAAVDFVEKNGKQTIIPDTDLGEVANQFIEAKRVAGLRPRYFKTLSASIKRFLIGRRDTPIREITAKDIQEYISGNGWEIATMRSYLVDVRTLFAFALKRKFITDNPSLAVDLPKVEDKPPGILTPKQAKAVLDAALDFAPDALAPLALILFGGLRRSEAEAIEWAEISDEFIEVKAEKAKTRRRRLNAISPQLAAWLDTAKKVGSTLPALNYADKLKLVLDKANLREDWSQNALRHSFASYHFAKFKDENETSAMMGNSPTMVFQNYRELVRPADAAAFFAIMPPANAVERAELARERKPRVMPPRDLKITPEVMAAVFEGGSLTRKEAVAALVERTACSPAAAYNALSLEGRFAAHLSERGEKLTWHHEPQPTEQLETTTH